jgi:hypothetical protein
MRRVLPEGQQLTLEVEQEHPEVNELVTRLESMPRSAPDREVVLDRLADVLRDDVRDEEDEHFPRLQTLVTRRHLQVLGLLWEVVRRTAPTRAHPIVARRPPGNVVAALPLSVLDRRRDGTDALRYRREGADSRALGAVSAALTRAAHAVEKLPLMRRGEDPSTHVDIRSARFPLKVTAIVAVAVGVLLLASSRRHE